MATATTISHATACERSIPRSFLSCPQRLVISLHANTGSQVANLRTKANKMTVPRTSNMSRQATFTILQVVFVHRPCVTWQNGKLAYHTSPPFLRVTQVYAAR